MISGDPKLPQLTPEESDDKHLSTGFYRRFQERFYTLWRELVKELTLATELPANAVQGPASSLDNQVARFDGTTGKKLQGSTVTIDDSGVVTVNSLTASRLVLTDASKQLSTPHAVLPISLGGTNASDAATARANLGAGTVTSVDLDPGTTGLTVTGGPITGSGTFLLSGTLAAKNGGTGQSGYTVGDILYASGTTALSKLADVATGSALISGGVGVAPSWGKIGLTTHVSGTLPTANGGTNLTSFTANGVVYASSTSALATGSTFVFDGTNVGIGTSSPGTKLDASGYAVAPSLTANNGILRVQTATSNEVQVGGYSTDPYAIWIQTKQNNNSGANFPLALNPLGGNVGIGTSSPSYKLQVEGGAIGKGGALGHHVEAYGAVGNGSTDDRDKIVDAINAAKTGTNGSNVVVFGAKNYRIASTIDIALKDNESVELRGVAPSVDATAATADVQGTRITFDNNTNNDIAIHVYGDTSTGTATPNHASFIIRDLWIGAEQTSPGTGQIGLQIGETGEILESYSKSIVDNVRCEDFSGAGFKVINTRRLHLLRCIAYTVGDTGGGIGCHIIATGTNYTAGDVVIDGCEFSAGGSAGTERAIKVEADSSGALCSGILVSNTVCYFGEAGIDIYASNAGTISDVFITNTQVDGFQTSGDADADLDYALYIRTDTAASVISNVHVSNSYFAAYNLHGVYLKGGGGSSTLRNCALIGNSIKWNDSHGIKMESVYGASIVGNVFNNNGTTATVNGDANIYVSLCQYFSIANNSGYNLNASTTNAYGVYLAADYSDQFSVVNNSMVAGYAATEDNSTGSNKTLSANYS